jgi:hypothetical protein
MGDFIEVKEAGKLLPAKNATARLLLVFGGTVVNGRTSGTYMWDYMGAFKDKFHIFVAFTNEVKGDKAYNEVMKTLEANHLKASDQILYLFSGGWRPGKQLLTDQHGADAFSSIYLVDIWMKATSDNGKASATFYKALADSDTKKLAYVFTPKGAVNKEARDYIANRLGADKAKRVDYQTGVDEMDTHMSTNEVAVAMIK